MTEYVGKWKEESASVFITSTCQLLPKSFPVVSDHMHTLMMSYIPAPKQYSIMCGSAAEFYIQPLNRCIADKDFLISTVDELAFSDDFSALTIDISGLSDTIECCKIESYDTFPGFVRLRVLAKMNYSWKRHKFTHIALKNSYKTLNMATLATEYDADPNCKNTLLPNSVSGPAIKVQSSGFDPYSLSDFVRSVWCPQWPREAQHWLKRPRNHGWPTIDTISEVVENGCHVVYVQHRSCRDDKQQWRLSFSIAEVILLQSWTQIQQIVHHLLRFFAKRELIKKDCPKEDEVLCPYHIKMLMLWTCEEMSPEWWNSSSVISICCELLKKLSIWITRRHYPNYFIPEANLFHEPSSSIVLEKIERRINEFCKSDILCNWFVENYILPFTWQVTPRFCDFMLPFLEFRRARVSISLDILFTSTIALCHKSIRGVIRFGLSSGLSMSLKAGYHRRRVDTKTRSKLAFFPTIENDLCFTYYDNLLHILYTTYGISFGEISWDSNLFVELVKAISMKPKIVRSQYHNFPIADTAVVGHFQFLRAQNLMKNLTGSNDRSDFKLLSLMSKELLRKALEYDDYKSNGIDSAALAYLAALHFATSEYKQAMHFCSAVLGNQTSQKEKESLNAGCLLFIDDIASIVGLCVLHKKVTNNNLHYIGRRLYLDLRLSPEVFAYYLIALSAERISKHLDLYHNMPRSIFPFDEYLKALTRPQCIVSTRSGTHLGAARQIIYRRTDSMYETESTIVNSLIAKNANLNILMEFALENMASFYSVIRTDFGIKCNTVDCYRALYLYKCRQYDEVLHLCERILQEPGLDSDLKELTLANVLLLPPLDSFFDGDVQSLLGFHTLFYYLSPLNDEMRKLELNAESTFAHLFAQSVYFQENGLSDSLRADYSIKCNYFLGRHFLGRYLKVRCLIDCSLPYAEALTEFAAHEVSLPFEHIIRRFLLQKLSSTK